MRAPAVVAGFLVALLAGAPAASRAAAIRVDTKADVHGTPGNCSLREAISSANGDTAVGGCTAGSGNDVIVIPGGTYRLTIQGVGEASTGIDNAVGDLDITDLATLRPRFALARVIIDGNGAATGDRVIQAGVGGAGVTIRGLTIRGGRAGTSDGGGIRNDAGVLRLERVTVVGNVADFGGGVYSIGGAAELTVLNSTLAGNIANGGGGGISVTGGKAALRNVTVAGNVADQDMDGVSGGGGLLVGFALGPVTARNTLLAANVDRGGENPDCLALGLASAGSNLIGSLQGCNYTPGFGDITGVAPRLRRLAFNGGQAGTRALRPGSPAVNRGTGCEPTDQRGLPRVIGGRCDIGAYELARCAGTIVNRVGTAGPDRLVGTNRRDGILALAGRDRVFARRGNDSVCGRNGRDSLYGQAGHDRLLGNAGPDLLVGSAGRDLLLGGPGRDVLRGLAGRRDLCHGGPGRDVRRAPGCEIRRSIP